MVPNQQDFQVLAPRRVQNGEVEVYPLGYVPAPSMVPTATPQEATNRLRVWIFCGVCLAVAGVCMSAYNNVNNRANILAQEKMILQSELKAVKTELFNERARISAFQNGLIQREYFDAATDNP